MSIVLFAELADETPFTESHKQAALTLRTAVEKTCGSPAGYSLKAWANEFRVLAKGVPDERWQGVLDAYCRLIGKEYIPQAFSAKTFRLKFLQIEKAVARMNESTPKSPISEQAIQIVRILDKMNWGNGRVEELPAVVQITLDQRRLSVQKLQSIPAQGNCYTLAQQLLQWFSNPHDFTVTWFRAKQKSLAHWKEWSGHFVKHAYVHSSPCLSHRLFALAKAHGNTQLANQLATQLGL